ncbi:uncharacterized protein BO88DRAFT_126717 [Aspergillus vadensis CBS 113365]|uniref:Uncharacterized protein n=1 Tax=Aspergillus vadensis (strain CBS 113365 / IMI 142717 / IBT 24658) TaxID=1448311 RepID=A0A319B349_ASPVC|nr:hypothetical protein BO88DRAFT_126717 [Aspergillus vadensis CBS 113365]PYH66211.1 hypothetical protein BO88DRAFT_126717 [Aspergillus vadensis CBS 113365]
MTAFIPRNKQRYMVPRIRLTIVRCKKLGRLVLICRWYVDHIIFGCYFFFSFTWTSKPLAKYIIHHTSSIVPPCTIFKVLLLHSLESITAECRCTTYIYPRVILSSSSINMRPFSDTSTHTPASSSYNSTVPKGSK